MTALEFEELVQEAIRFLEAERFQNGFDRTLDRAAKAHICKRLVRCLDLSNTNTARVFSLAGLQEVDKGEHLNANFEAAQCDPHMFDALVERIAEALEIGTHLHPVAARWLARTLRGDLMRPTTRGRPSEDWRNILIGCTIEHIAHYTEHPTRGDTSDRVSAIDAVKAALGQTGIASLSYGQLKDIWEDFQRDRIVVDLSEFEE